ncbi:pinopsin-like [Babylonia areolata]|uniref:pinopsin-like n=1 Tax=Babylonia areolata TaxID=304850 RepID=UPI003FCF2F23
MPNSTSLLVHPTLAGDGLEAALLTTTLDPYHHHPHRISDQAYTLVACVLSVVWVFGTLLNVLSLVVFACNKKLRSPTNMFVISLNVCDLGMSCFGTFPSMTSSWNGRWLYGRLGCIIEGFMVYFLGMTSLYLLCAISVDRYVVIAKPLLGAKINHKVAFVAILACWLGGFLWAFLPLVGWNEYVLEGAGISCSVVWESTNASYTSYIITIFFTCLVIPLGFIIFSYYGVYMTIRSMSRNQNWDKNSRIAKKNMKVEKKMAKTIAVMLVGYLGCWMPYTIFSFIVVFRGSGVVAPELATYPAIFAKSQGLWDPLLYVLSNKQFRQGLYSILPCTGLREMLEKQEEEKPDSDDEDQDEGAGKKGGGAGRSNKVAPADGAQDGKTMVTEVVEVPVENNCLKVEEVEMADSNAGTSAGN